MLKTMFMMNSSLTLMLNHPMALGTMLMLQTMLTCMLMIKYFTSPWYSYILFITIIGGLMIMFIYMASITSNKKFNMKFKSMLNFMLTMLIMMTIIKNLNLMEESLNKIIENKMSTIYYENSKSTMKFFNLYKSTITILMLVIMLILMLTVSSISSKYKGPLKKTYV